MGYRKSKQKLKNLQSFNLKTVLDQTKLFQQKVENQWYWKE